MSLLPNLTHSGPNTPLFAPAGAGGGALPANPVFQTVTATTGVITPEVTVTTLVTTQSLNVVGDATLEAALQVDGNATVNALTAAVDVTTNGLIVQLPDNVPQTGVSAYYAGGSEVDVVSVGPFDTSQMRLRVISTLTEPNIVSQMKLETGPQSFIQSYTSRPSGVGPFTDVGQLEFNSDGSFGLRDNTGLNTNIIINNGDMQINAATSMALSCGVGDLLTVNGAAVAGRIMSTPTSTNTVWIGANQVVPITSTFLTLGGHELRLAWNDRLTIESGVPAAADSVQYLITAGAGALAVKTVQAAAAATLGSTFTAHNVTFMPFGPGEAQLAAVNVGNFSTQIYLYPGQDVRLQDLGPVVELVDLPAPTK